MLTGLRFAALVAFVTLGAALPGEVAVAAAPAHGPIVLASVAGNTYGASTDELRRAGHLSPDALPFLVTCLARLQMRDFAGAVTACGRAIIVNPNSADGYRMRGAAELSLRRIDPALADFDRAITIDPENADSYALRGTAYREKEQFSLAIADFSTAIRLRPTDDRMWNGRCWVRALEGRDLASALSDCRQAIRLRPNRANTLDSMGFIHLRRSHYTMAYRSYDLALALDPMLASSLFGRGLAALHLYGEARARNDIARSFKLDPAVSDVFVNAHLIAQSSPLVRCQGEPCMATAPVHAPRKPTHPKSRTSHGSVRMTKV